MDGQEFVPRHQMDLDFLFWGYILGLLTALLILIAVADAYQLQSQTVKLLENRGFSNVEITGNSWFFVDSHGCGDKDNVMITASAINPAGKPINEVIVCFGYPFKAGTIRSR